MLIGELGTLMLDAAAGLLAKINGGDGGLLTVSAFCIRGMSMRWLEYGTSIAIMVMIFSTSVNLFLFF